MGTSSADLRWLFAPPPLSMLPPLPPLPPSPPPSAPPPKSWAPPSSRTPVRDRLWRRVMWGRGGDLASTAHITFLAVVAPALERALEWYSTFHHHLPPQTAPPPPPPPPPLGRSGDPPPADLPPRRHEGAAEAIAERCVSTLKRRGQSAKGPPRDAEGEISTASTHHSPGQSPSSPSNPQAATRQEYINEHGWEALQVSRVAPLTNEIIAGMLRAPAVTGNSVAAVSGRALWATLAQTGFRKAEVSLGGDAAFGPSCLTRHNLRWRIGGVEVADPTKQQLRELRDGDLAILIPPKSKCDQFGLEWGQAPIYLRFHARADICAARALRDLELLVPRRGYALREGTALFMRDDCSPLRSSDVDTLFKACLAQAGGQRSPNATYSPHSFRRYLACALRAQGAPDATIQALLRWKTAESLKLYSILNDETYADLVDGAGTANVASVRTNALPRAEVLDLAQTFHNARSNLRAAAEEAEATRPDEDIVERSDSEGSDAEDTQEPASLAAPAPPPASTRPRKEQRKRPRSSRGESSATAPRRSPPATPLTPDNAVGRHALAPAHMWPREKCNEHNGEGWEVVVTQVDKTIGAARVEFVHARTAKGKRFASDWLLLDALAAL
jgi:hypothetical protein